jgi:hypothetical protein
LYGGGGWSLLIGGTGSSTITGGSDGSATGGDILIGGTTTFDPMAGTATFAANEAALMSILAEWQSPDPYFFRFEDILLGTAYSFGEHVNGNNVLQWGTTLLDNGQVNTLNAQAGTAAVDWFFGNFAVGHTKINTSETGYFEDNT